MSQGRVTAVQQVRNFVSSFRAEPSRATVAPESLVDANKPKDWTVLSYMEGRDRLSNSVEVALNGMEQIGSTDSVNLIAQATLVPEAGDRRFQSMGEVNTRRYYITQDDDEQTVNSPVVEQFDEQKKLNEESLEDFLCWGMKKFPANHYMVVLKKHGLGFAANGSNVPLSARELRETLERVEERTGNKPDVVCWDSCNMQQWEVAYELKDRASVMTGSPEAIPATQFPYPTMLHNLVRYPKEQNAETMGQTVVQSYAAEAPQTTQMAVDLQKMKAVGADVRAFVEQTIKSDIPRDRLYTALMKSGSFEPKESLSLAYNFRDVAGFMKEIIKDEQIASTEVKDTARKVLQSMSQAQIDRNVSPERAHLKNLSDEVGPSGFLPWKQPSDRLMKSYSKLGWAQDTGWDRFLEFTLGGDTKPSVETSDSKGPRGLGNMALYAYKKYVSPYLLTDCPYDTSCSEYARISLKNLGPVEGAKWAFMRLVSCQDGAIGGADEPPEAPGVHHHHNHEHSHQHNRVTLPNLTLVPPSAGQKSDGRKRIENVVFRAARATGNAIGGSVAAIAGGLVGVVLGTVWGVKAGVDSLGQYNQELRATYGDNKVDVLERVQSNLTGAGKKVRETLAPVVGDTVSKAVGGAVGGLTGATLGLLGGGLFSYKFFGGFAGLAAQNLAKDAVGELPVHYRTEQILAASYRGQAEKAS